MPSYFVGTPSMRMTEPAGNSCGSAAAIPARTFTPDAVTSPLQYAVTLNRTEVPGEGAAVSLADSIRAVRESIITFSKITTNATAAMAVASSFIRRDRDKRKDMGTRSARSPRGEVSERLRPLHRLRGL